MEVLQNRPVLERDNFLNKTSEWLYEVEFDSSINLDRVWIDRPTLAYINSLRDGIITGHTIDFDLLTRHEKDQQFRFCHHCKQLKLRAQL